VILVGLTGGIGAGKSTVSALLAGRGAVIVDADAITRQVQEPGQPVLGAIAERFGAGMLRPDGSLDRQALADVVFHDQAALADLNAIVHPAVGREINRRIDEHRNTDHVVVLDVPLLVEGAGRPLAGIVVVDTPVEVAVARLVGERGMDEADARARIARQATREERLARADRVIDNGGDRSALAAQVDDVWAWMQSLPPVVEEPDPNTRSTE
jgi:dephospho-CoA kinase